MDSISPTPLPGRIEAAECARVRTAASRARHLHPGPVGELLARELRAYADFGHRFGPNALIDRLTAEILGLPGPTRLVDDGPAPIPPGGRLWLAAVQSSERV